MYPSHSILSYRLLSCIIFSSLLFSSGGNLLSLSLFSSLVLAHLRHTAKAQCLRRAMTPDYDATQCAVVDGTPPLHRLGAGDAAIRPFRRWLGGLLAEGSRDAWRGQPPKQRRSTTSARGAMSTPPSSCGRVRPFRSGRGPTSRTARVFVCLVAVVARDLHFHVCQRERGGGGGEAMGEEGPNQGAAQTGCVLRRDGREESGGQLYWALSKGQPPGREGAARNTERGSLGESVQHRLSHRPTGRSVSRLGTPSASSRLGRCF